MSIRLHVSWHLRYTCSRLQYDFIPHAYTDGLSKVTYFQLQDTKGKTKLCTGKRIVIQQAS